MSDTITPNQWRIFFASLAVAESISTACRKSSIPRATAYWHRKHTSHIAERWEDALADGLDYLKDAATERAVNGVTSTHIQYARGVPVASYTETKYSDRLLLALLASRDPAFRANTSDQVQTRVLAELSRVLDALQRRLAPDVYAEVIDIIAESDEPSGATSAETSRFLDAGTGS